MIQQNNSGGINVYSVTVSVIGIEHVHAQEAARSFCCHTSQHSTATKGTLGHL